MIRDVGKRDGGRSRGPLPLAHNFSPGEHDVICGRGKQVYQHEGNEGLFDLKREHGTRWAILWPEKRSERNLEICYTPSTNLARSRKRTERKVRSVNSSGYKCKIGNHLVTNKWKRYIIRWGPSRSTLRGCIIPWVRTHSNLSGCIIRQDRNHSILNNSNSQRCSRSKITINNMIGMEHRHSTGIMANDMDHKPITFHTLRMLHRNIIIITTHLAYIHHHRQRHRHH
mmetsp:Transcript_9067/g.19544  ORF Transcript_9067/g.19544 Transcript_9067/m.19544 type:complete len:227 (+) Transcript_9067:91-771(+)